MAKNTVTSFGLGNRIPQKPVEPTAPAMIPKAEEELSAFKQVEVKQPVTVRAKTESFFDDLIDIDVPETEKIEHKTKRVQLILKPSVHRKITKYLKARNQSLNDFISQYLEAFIEKKGL